MNSLEECEEFVESSINACLKDTEELKEKYSNFFDFNSVLTSDGSGKTRLNKKNLNSNHELIQEVIIKLNDILDTTLSVINKTIMNIMQQKGHFNRSLVNSLVYDDNNFFELLEMDLDSKDVVKLEKNKLLNRLEKLTLLKNRVYNLKYFTKVFDTSYINKRLNELDLEDLMNSKTIFEMIDTYGLQNEELDKFYFSLKNFENQEEKVKDTIPLSTLLEYHKRKVDAYIYENSRYKIALQYEIEAHLKEELLINRGFIENIVSNFIEQSSIDIVKKELKQGKVQKLIEVHMQKNKSAYSIIVKNNGCEIKDIHSLYLSDTENRFIIEARNLAREINARVDIEVLEGSGMQYSLEFNN